MKKVSKLIEEVEAATAVEYALILASVAAVIVTVVAGLGAKVSSLFSRLPF